MSRIFEYEFLGTNHFFYTPSNWTLSIVSKVRSKLKINKIDLARYILYYSQGNYKEQKQISYDIFQSLELPVLNKIFCDYINLDNKILILNSGEKISNIEQGVKLIITNLNNLSQKISSLLVLSYFQIEVSHVWIEALEGKFNEFDSEGLKEKWFKFQKNVIPNLKPDIEMQKQINLLSEFMNETSDILLRYAEIISLMINSLESSKLWIPARLTKKISKQFTELNLNKIIDYLPNLIMQLINKESINEIKKDVISNKLMVGRSSVINEIFECFNKSFFYSVINIGLTQIDYLVFEIVKRIEEKESLKNKYTKHDTIEQLLCKLEDIKNNTVMDKFMPIYEDFDEGLRIIQFISLTNYLRNHMFKYYDFDKNETEGKDLNRHAILHGKISSYNTLENSIRIIILIDDLLHIYDYYIETNRNLI